MPRLRGRYKPLNIIRLHPHPANFEQTNETGGLPPGDND